MRLTVAEFFALQNPLYRQPRSHEYVYLKKPRIDKINSLIHEDPPLHPPLDYAKELPFYDVLPDEKAPVSPNQWHDGMTKPSAIARLLEVNVVERDPPYGYRADTSRNFIRIHILRQYRMKQSELTRGRPKVKPPRANIVPFTGCFIHIGALPPELWLQVLESLHPIDLYHLSRVNKASSELFSSPSLDNIWREAFVKHKIPLQPVGWRLVSHVEWASLLFGPSACSTCGRKGAVIDFVYTRRVCRKCWVEVYVRQNGDPRYPPTGTIWSLLPATRRRVGGLCEVFWSEMKYYRPTVEDFAAKLAELHAQKETKNISEQELVEILKEIKEEYSTIKLADYEEWVDNIHQAETEYLNGNSEKWIPAIGKKLERMGYNSPDLVLELAGYNCSVVNSCKYVTYKFPQKLINKLQHLFPQWILERKISNLQQPFDEELTQAKEVYMDGRYSANYSDVEYMPTIMQLFTTADAPFYSLIDTELMEIQEVKGYPSEDVFKYMQRFEEGMKGKILAMLPSSVHASTPPAPLAGPTSPTVSALEDSIDRLELTVSVFVCINCVDCKIYQDQQAMTHKKGNKRDNMDDECYSEVPEDFIEAEQVPWQPGRLLVGWRSINGHFSCPHLNSEWDEEKHIVYSEDGADAARSLVSLVGLDPEVSKAEDMDRLDKRFTCPNCPVASTGKRGRRGRYVLTWKDCVLHYTEMRRLKDPQHLSPQWRKLASPMEKWIKTREEHHDKSKDYSWQCLHCIICNDRMRSKADMISHVQNRHEKPSPVVDEDYKHSFRGPTNRRKPVGMAEHPSIAQWYCGICQDLHQQPDQQLKLSSLRSILQHMKDKHKISTPERGREYRCYQVYDD